MFRKLIIFSMIFSACCMVPFNQAEDWKNSLNPYEQMRYDIIAIASKQLYKKYRLRCYGEGAATDMECKLKEMSIDFEINRPVSKDEGTKIVIEITNIFLHIINNYQEIHPYLCCNPFAFKNVSITLLTSGNLGNHRLAAISSFSGLFQYCYEDLNKPLKFETEPYEEVVKRLNIE